MGVIWYSKHQGLQGCVLSKARKFCRLKRIERVDSNKWIVKHIKGYNKTDYDVKKDPNYTCNCQYFAKTGSSCSHIISVELFEEVSTGNDTPQETKVLSSLNSPKQHPPISSGTNNNNNNNNYYIHTYTYRHNNK